MNKLIKPTVIIFRKMNKMNLLVDFIKGTIYNT